jgi:hypothetical protein
VAVGADQENDFGGDFVIDARTTLGGGFVGVLKPSGNYDSLLLIAVRRRASLVPSQDPSETSSIMDASGDLSKRADDGAAPALWPDDSR